MNSIHAHQNILKFKGGLLGTSVHRDVLSHLSEHMIVTLTTKPCHVAVPHMPPAKRKEKARPWLSSTTPQTFPRSFPNNLMPWVLKLLKQTEATYLCRPSQRNCKAERNPERRPSRECLRGGHVFSHSTSVNSKMSNSTASFQSSNKSFQNSEIIMKLAPKPFQVPTWHVPEDPHSLQPRELRGGAGHSGRHWKRPVAHAPEIPGRL